MTAADTILTTAAGGLMTVTLNRPDARNAFDEPMVAALTEAFERAAADPELRSVVLAGAGTVFCAGVDLAWMARASATDEQRQRDADRLMRMYQAIESCPVPVVARVQGAAYGGGLGLLAVCDLVVAAEDLSLALREVRVGLAPAVIAPFLLRRLGPGALRRYALTGEAFTAATAKRIGLVDEIVPAKDLDQAVEELTGHLAQGGPQAVRATKDLLRRLPACTGEERRELATKMNAEIRGTDEAREGMTAFVEKRPPAWARPPSGGRGRR